MTKYDRIVSNLESVGYEVQEKLSGWCFTIKCKQSGDSFVANNLGQIEMFYEGVMQGKNNGI